MTADGWFDWFDTGDIGRVIATGDIETIGRRKEIILLNGTIYIVGLA